MSLEIPYDHSDLALPLVEYLHERGVVRDPHGPQGEPGDLPAVFVGPMDDEVDAAVSVVVFPVEPDESNSNPTVTFQVALRSAPHDLQGMQDLSRTLFAALHIDEPFHLTAARPVAFCRRLRTGVTVPDNNRRWIRVDAYQTRVMVPRN